MQWFSNHLSLYHETNISNEITISLNANLVCLDLRACYCWALGCLLACGLLAGLFAGAAGLLACAQQNVEHLVKSSKFIPLIYTIVCRFIKQGLNLLQLQFCKSSKIHHISNQPYHVKKFMEMQELRKVMSMLPAASSCFWSSNPTTSFSACKYQIYTQFTVGVSMMPTREN